MQAYVMVIDCNNFFVSCERLFRPDLEGKPVLVLSSNDGCVVARSQEVKDRGIPMGAPYFQIKDIIKDNDITIFSGNHSNYRNISRRVMQVIVSEDYQTEQYSIDEAFIMFKSKSTSDALRYASQLRAKIGQWVGIPVSIGVGLSKTQAKLASVEAKKTVTGVFYIDREWCLTTGADVSVGTVWGIGRQLSSRYREYGIATLAQLITAPVATVRKIGGVVAVRQQAELSDQIVFKVGELSGPQKSLMSSQTFGLPTADKSMIYSAIAHHVDSIATDLQQKQLVTDTFQVHIRPKARDGRTVSRWSVHLAEPTNGNAAILEAVLAVLKTEYKVEYLCNKVGILAINTRPAAVLSQEQLFLRTNNQIVEKIDDVLTAVKKIHGQQSVQISSFSTVSSWRAQHTAQSPQYVTRWSDIPTVKTDKIF